MRLLGLLLALVVAIGPASVAVEASASAPALDGHHAANARRRPARSGWPT